MLPWAKEGKQYWKDELSNMMGIRSGNILPQELPEFKGMANMYNAQSNNQMANAIQQMQQRGITGGAAAGAISGMDENTKSGLMKMIQNVYGQVNQRAGIAADKGIDWQKYMYQLYMQMHNKGGQKNSLMSMMQPIAGGIGGLISGIGGGSGTGGGSGG